jgi:hypothetical protein
MGMFSSKLSGDKVTSLQLTVNNKQQNSNDTIFLKKYLDYLNQFGFLKIGIQLDNLKRKIKEEFGKAGLLSINEGQLPPEFKEINDILFTSKNNEKILQGIGLSMIPLGLMSLSGLICVVEPNPDMKSAVDSDIKLEIIIPNVLFSEANKEFIDLVVQNFNVESYKGVINAANNKFFFDKIHNVFRNIASDKTKINIKIINLIEFMLKMSMITMLISVMSRSQSPNLPKEKLVDYINGLIVDSFKMIKEDECIEKNSVFSYNTNICNVSNVTKSSIVSTSNESMENKYKILLIGSSAAIGFLLFVIILIVILYSSSSRSRRRY